METPDHPDLHKEHKIVLDLTKERQYEESHISALVFNELKSVNNQLADIRVDTALMQKDINYLKEESVNTTNRLEPIAAHNAQVCFTIKLGAAAVAIIGCIWTVVQLVEFVIKNL